MLDDILKELPSFSDGLLITVELTAGGMALMFVLAFALGTLARARVLLARGLARVLIEFFRGTSLVVQMFWLFFVLPQFGFKLAPLLCGILALGLNYGAYGAEIVRGALAAVPGPQREAAVALNLPPFQRFFRVTLPQAWVQMIPPFSVLSIQLLKGSAFASSITLADLTFQGKILRNATGNTAVAYGIVLILYFVLAGIIAGVMRLIEYLAKRRLGEAAPPREAWSAMVRKVRTGQGPGGIAVAESMHGGGVR